MTSSDEGGRGWELLKEAMRFITRGVVMYVGRGTWNRLVSHDDCAIMARHCSMSPL